MSQSGKYLTTSGPGSFVQTITGNTGGPVPPTAGNINLDTAGTTVLFAGNPGTSTITLNFGISDLLLGTTGSLIAGTQNVSLGQLSAGNITNGNNNTAIGYNSLPSLITGSNNTAMGNGSGSAYVAAESSNIVIGNVGTAAENNTIHIGTQGAGAGQQNRAFIAGITGINVGSVANVVSIDTGTGQLGTTAITAGTGITITPGANTITISSTGADLLTYTSVNNAASPYTVLTTDEYISADVTAGVITIRLPNAPATGRVFAIKDRVGLAATNNISVTTVGGVVTIDGLTTFVMNTNYQAIEVIFSGTAYEVF